MPTSSTREKRPIVQPGRSADSMLLKRLRGVGDEEPSPKDDDPLAEGEIALIRDLHASIYHALGIPPDTAYVAEKRPVYVTRHGVGKPHLALFA